MTIGEERSFLERLMDSYRAGDPSATDTSAGTRMVLSIQAIYTAIALQNYAAIAELISPEFELEIIGPPEIPIVGCWRGREEAIAAIGHNFGLLENQFPRILGVVAQESAVLVMGYETGRVVATQRDYSVHWVQWYTFHEGILSRVLQIFDSQAIRPAFLDNPSLPS
ncbi:MAG: nuclear transport factor 2 family protein [Planctomycetaceae bacterium]|nr:nuclear transport factor 2 family protein [Planctomycetaceae bacterium]